MQDGRQHKSQPQDASSDSSASSTRVSPPTVPSSPKGQISTVLTRSRLAQVAMHANLPNGRTDSLLNVNPQGSRPADAILTQHFLLNDRNAGSQSQQYQQAQDLTQELADLDRQAEYTRLQRVMREMEEERARGSQANGTYTSDTTPGHATRTTPAPQGATEPVSYYSPAVHTPSSGTKYRSHEHSSSRNPRRHGAASSSYRRS